MTRRYLISRPFRNASGWTSDDHTREVLEFEKHWDPYVRRLFGCALTGPFDETNCSPGAQERDVKSYMRARRAAMRVFDLKEK
jgi:hypothetical protein